MRVARVPIVADEECGAAYQGTEQPVFQFRQVCAGRTGLDTCYGDSGGPMFVPTSAGFRQIGITSTGIGCGATGFPGIYTQISSPPIGNFNTDATFGVR
ncbi:MAG: trypsin-like serine protease [Acidimicrobiales bacterium]